MADKTVLEKEKDSLIDQLGARILKNATERMKNIDDHISILLAEKLNTMVALACGFKKGSWDSWELGHFPEKSIIGGMMLERAQKAAVKFFKENTAILSFESMFSAKEKNTILKQLKEEYRNTFMQTVGKLAEAKASEEASRDAEALLDSVLEDALDATPAVAVGKEPPLPRCVSKMVGKRAYRLLLKRMVDRGMWFQVDPLPSDKFEVYVKEEEKEWLKDELEEISMRAAEE